MKLYEKNGINTKQPSPSAVWKYYFVWGGGGLPSRCMLRWSYATTNLVILSHSTPDSCSFVIILLNVYDAVCFSPEWWQNCSGTTETTRRYDITKPSFWRQMWEENNDRWILVGTKFFLWQHTKMSFWIF